MKRALVLVIVPVAAFGLAACGSSKKTGSTATPRMSMSMSSAPATASATQHNDADVMFAQMMIPHHQQAIEMAKLAATRASMGEVKKLATAIEGAQQPEIDKMTGWLTSWGATMPSSGGGMSMGTGAGMMSDADMKKLAKLSGMSFDKAFLQMMVKHHQGAITMAKTEQAQGQSTDAKAMAADIVSSQSAEIATMQKLLKYM
jgi:uncharacterized protein (DUF305 family)